jgi:hypothetical protein
MRLVDPRGTSDGPIHRLATRQHPDRVRRIGFLSNEEEFMHGALHFPRYVRLLQRALPPRLPGGLEFHSEVKPVLSRPAEPEQINRFIGWDAVVNGLAK